MRTLFLHIGYPKTGTTAIQEFMWQNRQVLLDKGVLYPETGIVKFAHHDIPWVVTGDDRGTKGLTPGSLMDDLKFELIENEAIEKVVISSEGFVFKLEAKNAKKMFNELFDEIKIIVYVRQPFRWIQSDYNQGVKGWRKLTCTFDEHLDSVLKVRKSPMDFYSMISGWANEFGWENITIRSYDLEKIDLVSGFLNVLGLQREADFTDAMRKDSNPRLTNTQLEWVRVINSYDVDERRRRELLSAILCVDDVVSQEDSGEKRLKFKANYKALERVNKSNKKFLRYAAKQSFDEDFFSCDDMTRVGEITQLDVQQIRSVIWPLIVNLAKNQD